MALRSHVLSIVTLALSARRNACCAMLWANLELAGAKVAFFYNFEARAKWFIPRTAGCRARFSLSG
jgi:hypothetical protein